MKQRTGKTHEKEGKMHKSGYSSNPNEILNRILCCIVCDKPGAFLPVFTGKIAVNQSGRFH